MFERKLPQLNSIREKNLLDEEIEERIKWLEYEKSESNQNYALVSSQDYTQALKEVSDLYMKNGVYLLVEYIPNTGYSPNKRKFVLDNLMYLYYMIQKYACKNNLPAKLRRNEKFYNVKINNVGYEIGSTIFWSLPRFFCRQVPINNDQEFIDFNDIISNKTSFTNSEDNHLATSNVQYDEVTFFRQDKNYYFTYKNKTYPEHGKYNKLTNSLTVPFRATFVDIPKKMRKQLIESLIYTYNNIDFRWRKGYVQLNIETKKVVDPIDNTKKYELICHLPKKTTISVYPLTESDLLNLKETDCRIFEYCINSLNSNYMREVPLVYARKHPGDDYYLLADDLLLTDQVTLASKFIELECDTIFRNNEKNLMNSNKKFIKRKR